MELIWTKVIVVGMEEGGQMGDRLDKDLLMEKVQLRAGKNIYSSVLAV